MIAATGGIAESEFIPTFSSPNGPHLTNPRHPRIRQRSHDRPLHPLRLRHKTHRHRRRLLILLLPRQTIPRNLQMPLLRLGLRLLRRTRQRPKRRHHLRRYPAFPPLPKHHVVSLSRKTRIMREGVYGQCGAGEEIGRDGKGEEVIFDGGGLDEVFPVECAD